MTPNASITPQLVKPPSPFTLSAILATGFNWAGAPGPISGGFIDPNTGGTLLAAIVNSDTQSNQQLIRNNAPGTNLITIQWFISPSDIVLADADGVKYTWSAGSLFVREANDGASAYTPPAVAPVVLLAVCGMPRPVLAYSDGVARRSCAAFSGTTYKAGMPPFIATPDNIQVQPGGFQPIYGDAYQVINGYMSPSGIIVEIGAMDPTSGQFATAPLPANG
jgi:hypothetical protein